jgi:hypothetical protein
VAKKAPSGQAGQPPPTSCASTNATASATPTETKLTEDPSAVTSMGSSSRGPVPEAARGHAIDEGVGQNGPAGEGEDVRDGGGACDDAQYPEGGRDAHRVAVG